MANDTDVLLTSSEAAQRLEVQRSTVERAVRAGHLAPVHRGTGIRGAMLFRAADVDAYAATRAGRVPATPTVESRESADANS